MSWVIKAAGCALLFGIGCAIGCDRANAVKQRAKTEAELLGLAVYIREQITNYKRPLGEILLGYCGEVINGENGLFSFAENDDLTWTQTLAIDENEKRELISFLSEIGKSYLSEQTALCDGYISHMSKTVKKTKDEYRPRLRAAYLLPILGAVSVIIIFI